VRVLVATIVAHPHDARILHRQIRLLLGEGWSVCYAAPWEATGVEPPEGVTAVDLPRAAGRRRIAAVRAARTLLPRLEEHVDVALITDVDLLPAIAGRRRSRPYVWDVREDTAAGLEDRAWVPAWARPPTRGIVHAAERWAERSIHLVLTDPDYQARFRRRHEVVPNHPWVPADVPESSEERIVYLGRISRGRGVGELIGLGRALAGEIEVHLIGAADPDVEPHVAAAHSRGEVVWHGFVPNERALEMIDGSLAGLSLLHDEPNYRAATPTKVMEYMAHGVPVITTPLPGARRLVERHRCGETVPFQDLPATVDAVRRLLADREQRLHYGRAGHDAAREHYDWARTGRRFLELLEAWARVR
jgi:glycosyltransferase involved in cell wall biosynthesis